MKKGVTAWRQKSAKYKHGFVLRIFWLGIVLRWGKDNRIKHPMYEGKLSRMLRHVRAVYPNAQVLVQENGRVLLDTEYLNEKPYGKLTTSLLMRYSGESAQNRFHEFLSNFFQDETDMSRQASPRPGHLTSWTDSEEGFGVVIFTHGDQTTHIRFFKGKLDEIRVHQYRDPENRFHRKREIVTHFDLLDRLSIDEEMKAKIAEKRKPIDYAALAGVDVDRESDAMKQGRLHEEAAKRAFASSILSAEFKHDGTLTDKDPYRGD